MITIQLKGTLAETWGHAVELRTSIDQWGGQPVPGIYDAHNRSWNFALETARYSNGFEFKFFVEPDGWQADPNLRLESSDIVDGRTYEYQTANLSFPIPRSTQPRVGFGTTERRVFRDNTVPDQLWDVIIIGSGMAGGTLADFLSDGTVDKDGRRTGLNVLVLEAGDYPFPTHIGNLPRQQKPGAFTKHIWELWGDYRVENYDRLEGNDYDGGQGFNLGGRSVFWGGFIPRMTSWELDQWPTKLKWYLEDIGYILAEDFMGRSVNPKTIYNRQVHLLLREILASMHHSDAPCAIRQKLEGANTVATGVFSTADVLTESLLTDSPSGREGLRVLLEHLVVKVESTSTEALVIARDRRRQRDVTFRAKAVVMCAGCLESARLAKRSGLPDPHNLIGKGTSDHPIYFTHFSIPNDSPYFDPYGNVKTLSQPKEGSNKAARDARPFNLLLELGADLNHGRYLDEDIFLDHMENRKKKMLCELVFLCNDHLADTNSITFRDGDPDFRPQVMIKRFDRPALKALTEEIKWPLLKALGAQPVNGPNIDPVRDEANWKAALQCGEGPPGGVAHEVGSLRMEITDENDQVIQPGVVNRDGQFLGLEAGNIYVCDLSIFPTTPAANPSLTAVALAIRLAEKLRIKLTTPETKAASSPMDNELIARWKFNEGAGYFAADSSRNNNHGTIKPADAPDPRWGTEAFAGSIRFSGEKNNFFEVPPSNSLNSALEAITVTARIYPKKFPSVEEIRANQFVLYISLVQRQWRAELHPDQYYGPLKKNGDDEYTIHYKWHLGLSKLAPDQKSAVMKEANIYVLPKDAEGKDVDVPTDAWLHLAGTYDGASGVARLYLNGELIGEQTHEETGTDLTGELRYDGVTTSRPLVIGCEINWQNEAAGLFNGYVDDVQIYRRALSREEILALSKS